LEEEEEGIPAGEEASFSGDRTNTELIKTGAGEEDERTVIEQRIKLFMLEKGGTGTWKDLGVCIVKVNEGSNLSASGEAEGGVVRSDSGKNRHAGGVSDTMAPKRRILARSEGTGKVLLNSWLNATVHVDYVEGKNNFTLLAFNSSEGRPVQYLIRGKEVQQVKELYESIKDSLAK
jgi:hypothetical protein